MMHREPSFGTDDAVIVVCSTLLAIVLGAAAAYAVAVGAEGAPAAAAASFKEVLVLIGAGLALIAFALQAPLVRFFLVAFAAVFFIALGLTTHGFTAL